MKRICLAILVGAVSLAFAAPASALPDFKKAFEAKYVKPNGNAAFAAAFKTASCNTCHVKGAKKNVRNDYGKELAKLIEGNAGMRIKNAGPMKAAVKAAVNKEAEEAMKKVEAMKAPGGGTYGEMFKAGELPPAP